MSADLTMTPTPLDELDQKLARLAAHRDEWAGLSAAQRASLLRACLPTMLAVADAWADTARRIKGYAPNSNGHGEEYLGGTLAVMRCLRLYAEALEAGGQPPLPKAWRRPDGQWAVQVFPQSALDKALFAGVTAELRIKPGHEPTQGALYRGEGNQEGGVAVVLGAGNQSSIPPMDVLYKLVVDNEVCVLKMNPVNEAVGPHIEAALRPLVERGFLEVCYGGVEQGKHLTDHPTVTSIHITGSARAHDAIIWGPGEQGEANKAAGTPRLDKHITSELGNVSPLLVVPGDWSDKELRYHARQAASMLAYNCGFNCNGTRLITVASGWAQKDRFLELIREALQATPVRRAYYPAAQQTWQTFTERYPDHSALGDAGEGELPWTILEGVSPDADEFALNNEPWCGVTSFVELEATTAEEFLDAAVPYANERCWGTLSMDLFIHPKTEAALGERFDRAITELRYGTIAINCWSGLGYGLVNTTWGAFPGHPLDDIQSGQGVVHNGLLLDHPEKSVLRAPFTMAPTPAWFTDHKNNVELGKAMTRFEAAPSWFKVPGVALRALRG